MYSPKASFSLNTVCLAKAETSWFFLTPRHATPRHCMIDPTTACEVTSQVANTLGFFLGSIHLTMFQNILAHTWTIEWDQTCDRVGPSRTQGRLFSAVEISDVPVLSSCMCILDRNSKVLAFVQRRVDL